MSPEPTSSDRRVRDDALITELRANGGRTAAGREPRHYHDDRPKSGQRYEKPLCARADAGNVIIAGTAGGQPAHTQWYLNLVSNPEVTVEFGGETYQAVASTVPNGPDRDRLFALIGEEITGIYSYQDRCRDTRQIPIIALRRV